MKLKKLTGVMALALALTLVAPVGVPMSQTVVAEAATVKISATKKTLTVGKSFTLKITGAKKKVTWSTSKKSVATVSSKGKVTAKKAGTATITAKVDGKKYTCKVTVKNPVNKYVEKAPFKAKEIKFGKYTAAAPEDWAVRTEEAEGVTGVSLTEKDAVKRSYVSNINIIVMEEEAVNDGYFEIWKELLKERQSKEVAEANLAVNNGTLSTYAFDEVALDNGKAIKISITGTIKPNDAELSIQQEVYYIINDGCLVVITINSFGDTVTPDVHKAGEYLVNSLIFTK
ncbi:Ig-like domain-containing protein [Acetivibrio ethanolgignens]|uniref:BIG2 domain-containing protein n=1 Tax=Acetivibrio ethanolgignens TaxID=290052 RepID=A0A0V8QCE2_9FIRM|nr:Ig-like domain-containing protein [Acetivibrio ethanolgignens]KSV58156.1 hypothetical protein ASU35_14055 [Acetivibrio ethanolgignens]